MHWISQFSTATTILLAADTASFLVTSLVFSERARRWVRSKRSGPNTNSPDQSLVGSALEDQTSTKAVRSMGLVRNPFDPAIRESANSVSVRKRDTNSNRRPSFRRSIALQQRVARYERTLSRSEISIEPRAGAGNKDLQIRLRLLKQSFEPLTTG